MTSPTTHYLESVYFTDANHGFAAGDNGTILKYLSPNGLEDNSTNSNALHIFPNPTNGKFILETTCLTRDTYLSIDNVNGQEKMGMQVNDNYIQVDLSNLPDGVYFVRLKTGNTVVAGKIVKE
jgi:hypothetical protein